MHPLISCFPNFKIYHNQILDVPSVRSNQYTKQYLLGRIHLSIFMVEEKYRMKLDTAVEIWLRCLFNADEDKDLAKAMLESRRSTSKLNICLMEMVYFSNVLDGRDLELLRSWVISSDIPQYRSLDDTEYGSDSYASFLDSFDNLELKSLSHLKFHCLSYNTKSWILFFLTEAPLEPKGQKEWQHHKASKRLGEEHGNKSEHEINHNNGKGESILCQIFVTKETCKTANSAMSSQSKKNKPKGNATSKKCTTKDALEIPKKKSKKNAKVLVAAPSQSTEGSNCRTKNGIHFLEADSVRNNLIQLLASHKMSDEELRGNIATTEVRLVRPHLVSDMDPSLNSHKLQKETCKTANSAMASQSKKNKPKGNTASKKRATKDALEIPKKTQNLCYTLKGLDGNDMPKHWYGSLQEKILMFQ
ncbi:hypothetical protein RJ641_018830, partial [Dillenia turbinata]